MLLNMSLCTIGEERGVSVCVRAWMRLCSLMRLPKDTDSGVGVGLDVGSTNPGVWEKENKT